MPTTQQPTLSLQGEATNRLLKDISHATYVICGEVHGVRENFSVYQTLLSTRLFKAFAYELLDKWETDLQRYLNQKKSSLPHTIVSEWKHATQEGLIDGKISKELIVFLKYLKTYGREHKPFSFFLFDPTHYPQPFSWNLRDALMAAHIRQWSAKYPNRKPILIVTGKLHARRKPFRRRGIVYTPLGAHLADKRTLFVELNYGSGQYYNITRKKFRKRKKNHQLGYVTRHKGKYVINVSRAHPVTPLAKPKRKPHLKKIT